MSEMRFCKEQLIQGQQQNTICKLKFIRAPLKNVTFEHNKRAGGRKLTQSHYTRVASVHIRNVLSGDLFCCIYISTVVAAKMSPSFCRAPEHHLFLSDFNLAKATYTHDFQAGLLQFIIAGNEAICLAITPVIPTPSLGIQSCQLPTVNFLSYSLPWLPAESTIQFQGLIFPNGRGLPNHKLSPELALTGGCAGTSCRAQDAPRDFADCSLADGLPPPIF